MFTIRFQLTLNGNNPNVSLISRRKKSFNLTAINVRRRFFQPLKNFFQHLGLIRSNLKTNNNQTCFRQKSLLSVQESSSAEQANAKKTKLISIGLFLVHSLHATMIASTFYQLTQAKHRSAIFKSLDSLSNFPKNLFVIALLFKLIFSSYFSPARLNVLF